MYNFNATLKKLGVTGISFFFLLVLCSSCANTRHLTYVQGSFDTAALSVYKVPETIIQKGDILNIIIYSDNPLATALYNQTILGAGGGGSSIQGSSSPNSGATSTPSSPTTSGYLVDDNGNIQMQGLKSFHVDGLTKQQLMDTLNRQLDEKNGGPLMNPYYTIRFVNLHFTLLGEVTHPGNFNIPGEHVNLFEGLGMAGDMTFYGRRDNVLIIRVNNGKREFQRLDLTKPDVFKSPYYFLQQGDVVYIEANHKKIAANDQVTARNVSLAATIISTIAIIYSIFRK